VPACPRWKELDHEPELIALRGDAHYQRPIDALADKSRRQ